MVAQNNKMKKDLLKYVKFNNKNKKHNKLDKNYNNNKYLQLQIHQNHFLKDQNNQLHL